MCASAFTRVVQRLFGVLFAMLVPALSRIRGPLRIGRDVFA